VSPLTLCDLQVKPAISGPLIDLAPLFAEDGADLMLPGVDPGALPQLPAGRIVSICVPGNPAPVAVSRPPDELNPRRFANTVP